MNEMAVIFVISFCSSKVNAKDTGEIMETTIAFIKSD